jgi:hypothetical protein
MLPVNFDFSHKPNKRQSIVKHNIAVLQQYNNIVKQRSIRLMQLNEQLRQPVEPEPVVQQVEPEQIHTGFKFGKLL